MFAHRVVAFTGPAAVQWTQVEEPAADDGVVIDVVAAGVSFADLLQTTGAYQLKVPLRRPGHGRRRPGPLRPARPGPGRRLTRRRPDAVRLLAGGHQRAGRARPGVARRPELRGRRGPPLNYLTGLLALVRRGRAQPGETLLVHGAAGGVGTAAIQLGRALGLRTIAVVR